MAKKITFDPELMGHIKTIYGDASLDEKTLKQLHQTWKSNPDIIRNTAKQKKSTAPLKGVSFNIPGTSSKPSKLQIVSEIAQDDLRGVKSFNTAFKEARNRGLKQFMWGTNKFKQGGKLDEKQKAFVAYLIEISGAKSESELNQYIQELGEEGLQEQRKQFEQLMTQGTEQIQTAAKGAKLNYIKALRGQCPEGFEMNYFKKGGVICSKCIKKAQAQQATPKAEKGTKVVRDFRAEMDKCGGKMKKKSTKKQTGGPIIEKDQGGNKMLSEKDWKKKVDSEAKADSAAYAKAYPNSEIAKKFNKDNPSKKKPIKKPAKKQGGGVISDFQRSLMNKQIAKKGLVGASTIFQKIANKGGKHAQAFSNMKQEIDNQVMSNSPLGKPVFSANNQAAPTPKIGYRVPNQSPISWQSRQVQQNGITFNQSSPVSYEIGTAYR